MFAKHYHEIQGTAMHAPVQDAERYASVFCGSCDFSHGHCRMLREVEAKLRVYSNWGFWRTLCEYAAAHLQAQS